MSASVQITVDTHSETPLYAQVEQSIRQAIERGEMAPGDRLPPIREICAQTGLAYATVSRATRNLVSSGVLVARTGSGTRVAALGAARTGAAQRTGAVGVLSTTTLAEMRQISPYFSAAFMAVQDECINRGHPVIYDRWSAGRPLADCFGAHLGVDGVILFRSHRVAAAQVREAAARFPCLVCLGGPAELPGTTVVTSDNDQDCYDAVAHLVALGHRHIAFTAETLDVPVVQVRHAGYARALRDHGLSSAGLTMIGAGAALGQSLVQARPRPTALLVASGVQFLPEALPALYAAGLHLGRDLYVCAYDEAHFRTLGPLNVPYLRLTHPVDELGHLAVQALDGLLAGQPLPPERLRLRAHREQLGPAIHPPLETAP